RGKQTVTLWLAGNRHVVPEAATEVEVVAVVLAGGAVADVGVQRVPVVGRLQRAVGAPDRPDLAGDARACGDRALDRRPVAAAGAVAPRGRGGIGREQVQREPLG